MTTTAPLLTTQRPFGAPYLVWPVGRREFYAAIAIALLPAFIWGTLIFGFRALGIQLAAFLGAIVTHILLKRFTARGRHLVMAYTLLSAVVFTALASPLWPAWIALVATSLMVLLTWLMGGPGAERVHASLLCAVLITCFATPYVHPTNQLAPAFLARDRLFMGDIRNQNTSPLFRWPATVETSGFDAIAVTPPATVAHTLMDRITSIARDAGPDDPLTTLNAAINRELDATLATQFPPMHLMILGVTPGSIGAVSTIGILIGGLYLAYRNILRPRSVVLFLGVFLLTSYIFVFNASLHAQGAVPQFLRLWQLIPGELGTLVAYSFLSSDAIFAAVVVLALPGTEPLTSRGRRVFLVLAAMLAAVVHRQGWDIPAATTVLLVLMPLANLFDAVFRKPSWLIR